MKKGTILVVLVALLLVGVRALDPPTNPLDEFLPLVAAQRVLAGEVPYRDYTSLYPPLTTLVDAALLVLFPASVLLARLVFVAAIAAALGLVQVIAARLSESERAGTAIGLLAACAHGAPLWGYSLVLATVLILGALRCALEPGRRWTIAAGILLGLASLARHDAATWSAIPIALVVGNRSRRELATLLGVAAAFPALLFLYLVATGALGAAFHQLVVIPATLYPRIRGLPWPLPWRGPGDDAELPSLGSIYAPLIIGALALAKARSRDERACAALPLVLMIPAWVRPDHAHVYAATLAAYAALGLLARAPRTEWRALAFALALVLPGAGLELVNTARLVKRCFLPQATICRRSPRTGMLGHGGIDEQRGAVLDLIATRPPGSRIFVALPRHDRIWINDVALYFDAQALPATRHHELYPLVATTAEVQEEIVRDLERVRPLFVVAANVRVAREPNASARTFDVHVLDEYLARAYEPVLVEQRYTVSRRR